MNKYWLRPLRAMKTREWALFGLFLIVTLILTAQPAAAATETFLDPGYKYDIGHVESGAWQVHDLDVTSTDDYDILALVFSHANNFDLYVVDPATGAIITQTTEPFSTENGLDFIWAVSTLKPGRYSVYVHATSGAGNFAFIHFYNRQPIQRTVGTLTTAPTTAAGGTAAVAISAQNMKFDRSTITVPARAQVTITFNNLDSGMPHTFSVYTDSSASTPIFQGQSVTGPATTTYTFTAPNTPGTYFSRCDVHPTLMTGQFIVQ